MPAKKPAAPTAPIKTTAADAHSLMVREAERRAVDARREVGVELDRLTRKLAAAKERFELGETLHHSDAPDSSALDRCITEARMANDALQSIKGWLAQINA